MNSTAQSPVGHVNASTVIEERPVLTFPTFETADGAMILLVFRDGP
ncbi:hypothetical protein [Arthrobacter sp. TWP1-1]